MRPASKIGNALDFGEWMAYSPNMSATLRATLSRSVQKKNAEHLLKDIKLN